MASKIQDIEFENSLILIYRNTIQPMTLCINVFREDLDLRDNEESVSLNYKYCLTVLSVDKLLTPDEINVCFREGVLKKHDNKHLP